MPYTLKTNPFGAGSTPTCLITRDLDNTGSLAVKDYASAAVTADLTIGEDVSPQTLSNYGSSSDKTLYGFRTTNNTTDNRGYVACGTNKPTLVLGASDVKTIVVICNALNAATTNACPFGASTSDGDFITIDNSSVVKYKSTLVSTALANRTATRTYAIVLDVATDANSKIYAAAAGASSSNITSGTPSGIVSGTKTYPWLGTTNSSGNPSSTYSLRGDIFLIAFFDVGLSQANIDSIHADPYGALLDAGSSSTATIAAYYQSMRD